MKHTSEQDAGRNRRAVLWDMDGTLLDSTEYHWLSWRETLGAEGYELSREKFAASFGQRNDAVMRDYFGSDYPVNEIERVADAKEARYRELIRAGGINLLPGAERLLERLHDGEWRQAIASSAPRLNIEAIIEALGIAAYFAAIVSAEDVERGKPDPQVFLIAADKVGVAPARCVVVEDAPAGIESGRRAGMRTIGVLTSHSALAGDVVVRTLEELDIAVFDDLLAAGGGALWSSATDV